MIKKIFSIMFSLVLIISLSVSSFASSIDNSYSDIILDKENATIERLDQDTIIIHVPVLVKQESKTENGIETYADWFSDSVDITVTVPDPSTNKITVAAYHTGFIFVRLDYLGLRCRTWNSKGVMTGNGSQYGLKLFKGEAVVVPVTPFDHDRISECEIQVTMRDGTTSTTETFTATEKDLYK